MNDIFSFSTSWNARRHTAASDLITEIKELGFESLELNFTLSEEIVEGIYSFVKEGAIKVISVHNYCPMPEGVAAEAASPDLFNIASLDRKERLQGIEQTKRTLNTASKLGAEAVIVHAGKVDMKRSGKELKACYLEKQPHSEAYLALRQEMMRERQVKGEAHLDMVLVSLKEIIQYAKNLDMKVGIETRYYIDEIPSFYEIGVILEQFADSNLFYWHDVGHAEVQERMGLAKSSDYLTAYGERMCGAHIHDVRDIQDHIAPLTGDIEFANLVSFLRNSVIKVIEVNSHTTAADIIRGKQYLEELWTRKWMIHGKSL